MAPRASTHRLVGYGFDQTNTDHHCHVGGEKSKSILCNIGTGERQDRCAGAVAMVANIIDQLVEVWPCGGTVWGTLQAHDPAVHTAGWFPTSPPSPQPQNPYHHGSQRQRHAATSAARRGTAWHARADATRPRIPLRPTMRQCNARHFFFNHFFKIDAGLTGSKWWTAAGCARGGGGRVSPLGRRPPRCRRRSPRAGCVRGGRRAASAAAAPARALQKAPVGQVAGCVAAAPQAAAAAAAAAADAYACACAGGGACERLRQRQRARLRVREAPALSAARAAAALPRRAWRRPRRPQQPRAEASGGEQ